MKRSHAFPLITTLAGVILGVATLGFVLASDSPVTAQADSTLFRQAIVPLLAADSAVVIVVCSKAWRVLYRAPIASATLPPTQIFDALQPSQVDGRHSE